MSPSVMFVVATHSQDQFFACELYYCFCAFQVSQARAATRAATATPASACMMVRGHSESAAGVLKLKALLMLTLHEPPVNMFVSQALCS
jgi:hypothetical protein